MNKQFKKEWLKALRSNKYNQGRRTMRSHDNYYCCLGVLCEAVFPQSLTTASNTLYLYDNQISSLSAEMQEVAGISDDTCDFLIGQNDDAEQSFKQIANWIEKNL